MIRRRLRAVTHLICKILKFIIFQKAKTNNFNLVANDYNSDENSDNENKPTANKPIFASLSSTVPIDPSTVKIYSLKADLPSNVSVKGNSTEEPDPNVVEKPTLPKPRPNTFASIITGGRSSPNDQDNELIELMKQEVVVGETQTNAPVLIDKPIELDVKTFKRKRRIEFMTRPIIPIKTPTETTGDDDSITAPESETQNINSDVVKVNDEPSAKSLYSNFVRANVEFSGAVNQPNNVKVPEGIANDELNKQKSEICDLRTIIESKLKFLCNGRPDVSAVQAIFIQFEVSLRKLLAVFSQ